MSNIREFAEFLQKRKQFSIDKTPVSIIEQEFINIFINGEKDKPFYVVVHDNQEIIVKLQYKNSDNTIIATQVQEKSSILKPFKIPMQDIIRRASLKDLLKHNII